VGKDRVGEDGWGGNRAEGAELLERGNRLT
jgi:hypothetical protein